MAPRPEGVLNAPANPPNPSRRGQAGRASGHRPLQRRQRGRPGGPPAADARCAVVMVPTAQLARPERPEPSPRHIQVRLVDVAENKVIFTSAEVNSAGSGNAQDNEKALRGLLGVTKEYIETDLLLGDMPELTPEAVHRRAETLVKGRLSNPLPALAELRYYEAKKLLSTEEIADYYGRSSTRPTERRWPPARPSHAARSSAAG